MKSLINILASLVEQDVKLPSTVTTTQNRGSYDSPRAWEPDGILTKDIGRIPGKTIGVEVSPESPDIPEVDITGGAIGGYEEIPTEIPQQKPPVLPPGPNGETRGEYEPPWITNCISPDQVPPPPESPIIGECERIKKVMGIKERVITEQAGGTWSLPAGCGVMSSAGCPPCSPGQTQMPPISAYPDPCADPFTIPIFHTGAGPGYDSWFMNDNGLDSFYNIFINGASGNAFPGNIPSNPANFTANLLVWFINSGLIPWYVGGVNMHPNPPYSSITDLLQNHPWFQQYLPNGLVQPGGPGGPCNMSLPQGSGSAGPITYSLGTTAGGIPILLALHGTGGGCFAAYLTCMSYTPPAPIPGCMDPTAVNYNPNATVDDGSCIHLTGTNTQVTPTGWLPPGHGFPHSPSRNIPAPGPTSTPN